VTRRVDRSRLPDVGPPPLFRFPAVRKRLLPHGMAVWTVEHPSVPVVTFVLLVTVGSAVDPPGRSGLASLTGDMLDEGAGSRTALEVNDALARIGAAFDTEVGPDATFLTLTTLARCRDRGLGLLADLVVRPRFEPHEFERVRHLRANRLRQLRDLPPAVADRAFAALLYGDHPYGHLAIGTEGALESITLDEVRTFHQRAYRPANATLIAVGDATHDELFASVEAAFGSWTDAAAAHHEFAASLPRALDPPTVEAPRLAVVDRPGAAQSELRIGHVAAPRTTPDYHALVLLNMALGGQFVSRINMNLRENKGYTYGARTSFDFRRGPGPFLLQVSVQTAVTADAIRESLAELHAVGDDRPITERELEVARAALTRGYPRNFETAEQIARSCAQLALYGLPDDYFERFVPTVRGLEVEDIHRVAARWLDAARLSTLIVGDRSAFGPDLDALGLGEATVAQPM
jgi:predicted Zn-dependent peptidase